MSSTLSITKHQTNLSDVYQYKLTESKIKIRNNFQDY